jgi:hypothetical protein
MSDTSKVQMNFNAPVQNAAGNVEHDFIVNPPPKTITESAVEIQQLLTHLQQTYPSNLESAIQQEIKHNPTFKARLRNAFKEGGLETLKVLFAPLGIGIEAVRGWVEAE